MAKGGEHPTEDIYAYITARISPEKKLELDRFLKKHPCKDNIESPIGEWHRYIITPTAVVEAYSVECLKCGHKLDLTEYNNL